MRCKGDDTIAVAVVCSFERCIVHLVRSVGVIFLGWKGV
jgi:hypothetical protein